MRHALAHAGNANIVYPEVSGRIKPRPARRHRVPGPFDPDHRARELISTGIGLRTSKLAAGSGSSEFGQQSL
jgi:hypothetical protein